MPDGLSLRQAPALPVADGDVPEVLASIVARGTDLAIWQRSPADPIAKLAPWLDALAPEHLPDGRFIAPIGDVARRLAILCDLVELRDGPERTALIDDITCLAGRFAAVARIERVDVKLEAIDHDSCWRFHRDHVGFRLNATYRGPGTEWVSAADALRALRSQHRYRGPVSALPRFAAGLFKGVKLAGKRAVVHRSPPIAGRGLTRLFLCLNEPMAED